MCIELGQDLPGARGAYWSHVGEEKWAGADEGSPDGVCFAARGEFFGAPAEGEKGLERGVQDNTPQMSARAGVLVRVTECRSCLRDSATSRVRCCACIEVRGYYTARMGVI